MHRHKLNSTLQRLSYTNKQQQTRMTSPSLIFGSILLAFSPSISLLLLLIFQKPQLVILAVCSAFAYLLSALLSSVFWLIISSIDNAINGSDSMSSIGTLLGISIPSVLCQMIIRCVFVSGYFKVENVIRKSVAKHEEETLAAANSNGGGANSNGSTTNSVRNGSVNGNTANNNGDGAHAETNALQLQLNDLSCSLASGCGYALLHSLFLYGTLLASESGEANSYNDGVYAGGGGSTGHGGTLYQDSCAGIPSLINGALIACLFSILDVMWMMLCFFGMRRRMMSSSSLSNNNNMSASRAEGTTIQALIGGLTCQGFNDTSSGGSAAILFVGITHLLASLVLAPNGSENGCKISLPCLGGVVVYVGILFRRVTKKGNFLPEDQRRRIQGMQLGLRSVDQSHHVE